MDLDTIIALISVACAGFALGLAAGIALVSASYAADKRHLATRPQVRRVEPPELESNDHGWHSLH